MRIFLTPPRGICVPIFISILFSVKPWHAGVGLDLRSYHIQKMYLPIHVDNNILSLPHPTPGLSLSDLFSLFFPLSRVKVIYPVPHRYNMHDSRVAAIFQYAVDTESSVFANASSSVSPKLWVWSL